MRCFSPVSRLNSVLFPELGVPTTAMLASLRFATVMSLTGTRVSEGLVTSHYRCNFEKTGMLLSQRNAVAEEPEFNRVSTDCRTRMLDLGSFNETEDHEALNLWVRRVNSLDDAFLAAFKGCERVTVDCHKAIISLIFRDFPDNCINDNDSHYELQ